MALSLLQIIQRAQAELGLPQAATVIGNTDPTTVQMYNMANRVLDDLRRMHPTGWANLHNEYEIIVSAPVITVGDVTLNSNIIVNIPVSISINNTLASFYWQISANGTPVASRVLSVDSATQVTMTMQATQTSTQQSITFAKDTYPMPGDYDWSQSRTHWDRTNRWALIGPDSPQIDQWHRSGIVATGPRRHFRRLGQLANQFRIWPAPAEIANPLQLVFEYLSINAVQTVSTQSCTCTASIAGNVMTALTPTSGFFGVGQTLTGSGVTPGTIINAFLTGNGSNAGTYQVNLSQTVGTTTITGTGTATTQYFNADTDVPILDDQAITTGIKWLFYETKGFNVAAAQGRWIDYVNQLIARDTASETLPLVRIYDPLLLTSYNVQDGFFPAGVSTVSGS